jgi:hypothetical protein
MGSIEIKET